MSDTYDYKPNRMIRDGRGRIIENRFAPLEFKEFEAEEEQRKPPGSAWANRLTREVRFFSRWVGEQKQRAGLRAS